MVDIPLSRSDYFRAVAKEARIRTRNRYFEQNPILTTKQVALLARPGLHRYISVGDGPIRAVYSQSGSFSDALFVVSDQSVYRVDTNGTVTYVGEIPSGDPLDPVSMAATSVIGTTPAFLFIAGGSSLMCYMENGYALGTVSGTPANGNTVQVSGIYYQFTSGSVNAGAPAGTLANPWLVALGTSATTAWQNLADAFGNKGVPGTSYSTALTANTQIEVQANSAAQVVVRSTLVGALGNATSTTATGVAWAAATLTGGGAPTYFQVGTPDDVGIISLGYIASYVVCVPAQGQDINGRFFWINPGETTIDPLDFATAERAPDPIFGVVVFGDQFWLPGSTTTEVWYFTGNADSPVLRVQGIVFDRGAWAGTAIQVKDSMIIVDNEGAVFQVAGGMKRISRPDIEERIRNAIQYQASQGE